MNTALAVTLAEELQQDQTFLVLKVLFHLSPPWASLLAHENAKRVLSFFNI